MPGVAGPSYLFGTIHLICADEYVWTTAMQRCFESSDAVCLELDLDDPATLMKIGMGMMNSSGQQLKAYFTDEEYKILSSFLRDSLGTSISLYERMKPAALLSLVASLGMPCKEPISYESRLMSEALAAEKSLLGLETPEEQLTLLSKLPTDSIVRYVLNVVEDKTSEAATMRSILNAYKKQDLNTLDSLIHHTRNRGDNTYLFLEERNQKWIERMKDLMREKAVFFAVGAAHLPGTQGLIELLRQAGCTVEPMP